MRTSRCTYSGTGSPRRLSRRSRLQKNEGCRAHQVIRVEDLEGGLEAAAIPEFTRRKRAPGRAQERRSRFFRLC